MKPVSLFLMAHQDDEFGIFHQIEKEINLGKHVFCIYVTDGGANGKIEVRDAESRYVLQKLGVKFDDIIFVGREISIDDGKLYLHVNKLVTWLYEFIKKQSNLDVCFVPCWEGGHPDHDILHAISVTLINRIASKTKIYQYSLYNGHKCISPFFRVLSPLINNGPIKKEKISLTARLRYILFCLSYSSQWKTWLGLFPFVFIKYLFNGHQQLQNINLENLNIPPHSGVLYYEMRGFLNWPDMQKTIKELRETIHQIN